MARYALLLALCLSPLAWGLSVQPRAIQLRAARPVLARPIFPCMQEGEEPTTPPPAAAPAPTPPPAMEEPKPEFDITNYSITITLAVVFVLAKAAGYFGLIDSN